MRAVSASTSNLDPYRAGVELGESVASIEPEVVFLFSSIQYAVPDLLEGLHDAVGRDDLIVFGNSGDGCFETAGVFDFGAAVLALTSKGHVRWQIDVLTGLKDGFVERLGSLLSHFASASEVPQFAYLVTDFRVDAGQIETTLQKYATFPIVGGLAMDDRRGLSSYVYINREVRCDALALLSAYGDIGFSIALGNAQRPVGHPGHIDAAAANQVRQIDGISAAAFIERETGKPVLQSDRGVLSVRLMNSAALDEGRLRSIMLKAQSSPGAIGFFGGMESGDWLQVCQANPEQMLGEVEQIAVSLRERGKAPAGALIVSCTGRKSFLGKEIEREVDALNRAFPPGLPLAGFPSRGEIAPLPRHDGYTHTLFHNMTYVVLLIWQ